MVERSGSTGKPPAQVPTGDTLVHETARDGMVPERHFPVRHPLRVVAIGDGDIASVELIASKPLAYLARTLRLDVRVHYATETLPTPEQIVDADILLLVRAYDAVTLATAHAAVRAGVPVIYAVDDDFDLLDSSDPVLGDIVRYLRDVGAYENVEALARLASQVWAFSPPLVEKFRRFCPDVRLTPAITGLAKVPDPEPHPGEMRLGYAGSLVHADNVAIVEPVLRDLLKAHPNLVVETIGQEFGSLRGHPRYRIFPVIGGLDHFFHFLVSRGWDAAVAPLRDTPLSAAKTDNKYRTYAAAGIPAVYSRVPVFAARVQDGVNGLLASEAPQTWSEAIGRLLSDPALRRDISARALKDVRSRFSIPDIAHLYLRRFADRLGLPHFLVVGPSAADAPEPLVQLQRRGFLNFTRCDPEAVGPDHLESCDALVLVGEAASPTLLTRAEASGLPRFLAGGKENTALVPLGTGTYAAVVRERAMPDDKASSAEGEAAWEHVLCRAGVIAAGSGCDAGWGSDTPLEQTS